MSVEGHIESLQKKKSDLEKQLQEISNSPAVDEISLQRIKKEKLKIKDELQQLGAA